MARGRKKTAKAGYMISSVAEMFHVHPQTLRLYEREGLLAPSRSEGNTRLYTQHDLERLKAILNLTRDLGVNLAGIEIVLNMRERMKKMQEEMQAFVEFVQREFQSRSGAVPEGIQNAIVRVGPPYLARTRSRRGE
jgi:MerR family transcriptional regulator/heat shock protein HspR